MPSAQSAPVPAEFIATIEFFIRTSGARVKMPAVTVPGPGVLALTGKDLKPQRPAVAARRATLKPVTAAGETTLTIKAKGKAKKKLKKKGKAKLTATVTFTPTGGTPNAQTKKIKLKRKRKR